MQYFCVTQFIFKYSVRSGVVCVRVSHYASLFPASQKDAASSQDSRRLVAFSVSSLGASSNDQDETAVLRSATKAQLPIFLETP